MHDEFTQEELEGAGYEVEAAPRDAWREYDENNPIPGYFQFDWLSSRHPDLYHAFALSSKGLVDELNTRLDQTGLDVLDLGAGTGRITMGVAGKARRVTAVDIFPSVISYGNRLVHQAGIENVAFIRGDCFHLPFSDNSFDAAVCAWAVIDHAEAWRVLKPGGWLVDLLPVPGGLCGELTSLLADVFPTIVTEIAPSGLFDAACPDSDARIQETTWNGVPVMAPVIRHDFTYVADYGESGEAAAILGRLYGPKIKRYMLDRRQSTVAWRLRIEISRIRK
jgi:ubiquinone/menaquinone biosynthesis C-methylase UbiE